MTATVTREDRRKAVQVWDSLDVGIPRTDPHKAISTIAHALAEAREGAEAERRMDRLLSERELARIADLEAKVTALQVMNESFKEQLTARVCDSPTDTTDKPTL